jgi:hypothetical protein
MPPLDPGTRDMLMKILVGGGLGATTLGAATAWGSRNDSPEERKNKIMTGILGGGLLGSVGGGAYSALGNLTNSGQPDISPTVSTIAGAKSLFSNPGLDAAVGGFGKATADVGRNYLFKKNLAKAIEAVKSQKGVAPALSSNLPSLVRNPLSEQHFTEQMKALMADKSLKEPITPEMLGTKSMQLPFISRLGEKLMLPKVRNPYISDILSRGAKPLSAFRTHLTSPLSWATAAGLGSLAIQGGADEYYKDFISPAQKALIMQRMGVQPQQ